VNPDTIGYGWTGEYDLNTLRVDGETFEFATKKLRIRKYPYTCGQGLSVTSGRNTKNLSRQLLGGEQYWLITSECTNQSARKALFTCVVNTNIGNRAKASSIAFMRGAIILAKMTTKPRFENAKFRFYH